jgi:hypothetical protein
MVNDKRKQSLHVQLSQEKSPHPRFIKGGQGGFCMEILKSQCALVQGHFI